MSSADDRRPGDDTSLHALYDLVPDAYELDLLAEVRQQRDAEQVARLMAELRIAWGAAVAGLGYDEPEPEPEAAAPSVTQARFMVERLLGGRVVDDDPH